MGTFSGLFQRKRLGHWWENKAVSCFLILVSARKAWQSYSFFGFIIMNGWGGVQRVSWAYSTTWFIICRINSIRFIIRYLCPGSCLAFLCGCATDQAIGTGYLRSWCWFRVESRFFCTSGSPMHVTINHRDATSSRLCCWSVLLQLMDWIKWTYYFERRERAVLDWVQQLYLHWYGCSSLCGPGLEQW